MSRIDKFAWTNDDDIERLPKKPAAKTKSAAKPVAKKAPKK